MRAGLLTGKMTRERALALPENDWRSRDADFQEPKLSRNLQLVELLKTIGAAHGKQPGEVALAWALYNPAITAAIVGLRKAEQVNGTSGALDFRLSASEVAQLEAFLKAA
jgi:aryl-alcohol dehydrogenase-like predicted oxidoreductase